MSSHAKPFPRWLDTLFACLSWRVSTGRHTENTQPAREREPFGADPEWPDDLALLCAERSNDDTQEIPVVQPEVRA